MWVSLLFAHAQKNNFRGFIQAQGIFTSKDQVPLWMRSNQFGSLPLRGISASLAGGFKKQYDSSKKLIDWGFGFEGRGNFGSRSQFLLIEADVKLKIGVAELKAGRSKDIMGLIDTSLSSGAFSISGNALGIPKVQIGIPGFSNIFGGSLVAVNGNFAYGWVGDVPIQYGVYVPNTFPRATKAKTYFHQKSLYFRIGKPSWKVKFYGGGNDQVFWGEDKKIFGPAWTLSPAKSFLYTVALKKFSNDYILNSSVGNHLSSIDMGFQYEFKNLRLFVYRQNITDVTPAFYFANGFDGLNGVSVQNKKTSSKKIYWKKFLFEIFATKNQNGDLNAKRTGPGDENYYNHAPIYAEGWSYKGLGLGNPLITSRTDARSSLPSNPLEYFISTRLVAFYLGNEGWVSNWTYLIKLSYSKNYGTWATSPIGKRALNRRDPPNPFVFPEVNQFSGYLEAGRALKNNYHIGCVLALDAGKLLYNSTGAIIKVSKSF